jgi:hypothetical protein
MLLEHIGQLFIRLFLSLLLLIRFCFLKMELTSFAGDTGTYPPNNSFLRCLCYRAAAFGTTTANFSAALTMSSMTGVFLALSRTEFARFGASITDFRMKT